MKLSRFATATIFATFLTSSLFAQTLYPAKDAKDFPPDAQLSIAFENDVQLNPASAVVIYDASGNEVDKIAFADEVQTFYDGANVNVGSQLVRLDEKKVYITPHNGKIAPETSYYVVIEEGAITSGDFKGFAANEWAFTTKASAKPAKDATVTVNNSEAGDNNADFHSIQAALEAVKDLGGTSTISVAAGTYYELLHYNGTTNIVLQGPAGNKRGDNAVIKYINCNDLNGGQQTRVSFLFVGADLTVENLSFINLTDSKAVYSSAMKAPSGNAQAETLYFRSGKGHYLNAYNCSFSSHQDTMQISGKCWFYDCFVEGDVDYVWGTADVALFENCDFNCLFYVKKNAYLFETRVGTTEKPLVPKGFVLYNSRVNVEKGQTAYYGRRATAVEKAKSPYYDQCAIVNVAFHGEGGFNQNRWQQNKAPRVIGKSENVGWKEYNVTFTELQGNKPADTVDRCKYAGDIDKKTYKAEYSHRDLIMNRVFDTENNKYVEDTETAWDLNQLARDRGYPIKDLKKSKKKK